MNRSETMIIQLLWLPVIITAAIIAGCIIAGIVVSVQRNNKPNGEGRNRKGERLTSLLPFLLTDFRFAFIIVLGLAALVVVWRFLRHHHRRRRIAREAKRYFKSK